ncbi:MAG: hypothetical protein JNJ52_05325 [Flavobacterium sp.]|nr:hypothetical protein [Flavobacterium sp.]
MKKRLEAELLSIAHRILKLKNKSEVDQLYHETQKLYEALTVLKFYSDNYEQVKSEIAVDDLEEKLSASLEIKTPETPIVVAEPIAIEEPKEEVIAETKEEVVEEEVVSEATSEEETIVVGEITLEEEEEIEEVGEQPEEETEVKSDIDFAAMFELAAESPNEIEDEKPVVEEVKAETKQISFEELLGENYNEPVFVKPNDITKPISKKEKIEEKSDVIVDREEGKPLSLNDKLSKTINIGLNDRMGFVKFLFGDSTEDYNRVLSQLNTFSTFEEAKDFIEEIIKPDYNNWEGADEFAERFIGLVEKKFL